MLRRRATRICPRRTRTRLTNRALPEYLAKPVLRQVLFFSAQAQTANPPDLNARPATLAGWAPSTNVETSKQSVQVKSRNRKEVNTMNYVKPEVTLTDHAVAAI